MVIAQIVGGVASVYAAKSACDATIKSYSPQAIFVTLAIITGLGFIYEIQQEWSLQTITRLASVFSMTGVAWFVFWKEES